MQKRYLGREKLEVSAIGLGCMGMSEFYGDADESESLKVLHRSLDMGMNFWDTADVYGSGANEILLEKVLRERRDEVVLATKFGIVRSPEAVGLDGSFEYMQQCLDNSLQRLGVDHIDLYYLHRRNPAQDIEEIVDGMAKMVKAGKIRHIGLSETGADSLRRACAVHPVTALQSEYSLWSRDIEGDIIDTCRELGVGIVPYSPLGRGFLTGAIRNTDQLGSDDYRLTTPRFDRENFDHNLALLETIEDIAGAHRATAAQTALAWVLAQGDDMVPIPGTKRLKYLEQNADALKVSLTGQDLQRLDSLSTATRGMRYNETGMSITNI